MECSHTTDGECKNGRLRTEYLLEHTFLGKQGRRTRSPPGTYSTGPVGQMQFSKYHLVLHASTRLPCLHQFHTNVNSILQNASLQQQMYRIRTTIMAIEEQNYLQGKVNEGNVLGMVQQQQNNTTIGHHQWIMVTIIINNNGQQIRKSRINASCHQIVMGTPSSSSTITKGNHQ